MSPPNRGIKCNEAYFWAFAERLSQGDEEEEEERALLAGQLFGPFRQRRAPDSLFLQRRRKRIQRQ